MVAEHRAQNRALHIYGQEEGGEAWGWAGCVLAMGARARPLYLSALGIVQLLSPSLGLSTPGRQPASSSAFRGSHFRHLGSGPALRLPGECPLS